MRRTELSWVAIAAVTIIIGGCSKTRGNELTMKINQWAAEAHPIAQKHLDTARTLKNATNHRLTN